MSFWSKPGKYGPVNDEERLEAGREGKFVVWIPRPAGKEAFLRPPNLLANELSRIESELSVMSIDLWRRKDLDGPGDTYSSKA
jgi:hypothetical protein